ncbi:phosphotransferase enzyme family protein [Rhizobium giardinii]|uniref:phosphotransferase enzyme family protein n=1 Tax=Rhizobium giardinii TaxID=56731 RepID=UPI0039E01A6A
MSDSESTPSLAALTTRAREALGHWGLGTQKPHLLKFRENAVFRIVLTNGEPAALRLHRPGYHDENALKSELSWMAALRRADLRVPAPIATPDGRHIVSLEATANFGTQHADIVSWMNGSPLGQSGVPLPHSRERLATIFRSLGETMARMHAASDAWLPPPSFSRPAWDANGLLGDQPLWGRFWDCAGLSAAQAQRLGDLRQSLQNQVNALSRLDLDYGLIHADLVRENVLVGSDRIELIDFDDSGHGWRMFDISTALFKNRKEPEYPLIRACLIEGYRTARPLPDHALDTLPLFEVLRSLTYIGWIGERSGTPDATIRMQGYVADALALADALRTGP